MTETMGKVNFFDGMRVSRGHLDHLQNLLLSAAVQGRGAVGAGVVCGLEVVAAEARKVQVKPGLAFDNQGRGVLLKTPQEIDLSATGAGTVYMAIKHTLSASGVVGGVSTILSDGVEVIVKVAPPPFDDGSVVFARLDLQAEGVVVAQLGSWYLPPLFHAHTGTFYTDSAGNLRYDGDSVSPKGQMFDSGFLLVNAEDEIHMAHGLGTSDLFVQVQCRKSEEGPVTTEGLGSVYWYELVGDDEVILKNSSTSESLLLRVQCWPLSGEAAGPLLPIASAGSDETVEFGVSFTLDGSGSRAFGGRRLVKYRWTQLS